MIENNNGNTSKKTFLWAYERVKLLDNLIMNMFIWKRSSHFPLILLSDIIYLEILSSCEKIFIWYPFWQRQDTKMVLVGWSTFFLLFLLFCHWMIYQQRRFLYSKPPGRRLVWHHFSHQDLLKFLFVVRSSLMFTQYRPTASPTSLPASGWAASSPPSWGLSPSPPASSWSSGSRSRWFTSLA